MLESIARFVDAVVHNAPLLATGAGGVAAARVLCAILTQKSFVPHLKQQRWDKTFLGIYMNESARTGQPVDLAPEG